MKMRELHVVPLSSQAVALLSDLHTLTGKGYYVFPSIRSKDRPISDNTINAALRRLGFSADEMVAHGFRSTASTCLNELGCDSNEGVRDNACFALEGIGPAAKSALPALRHALSDPSSGVRRSAQSAIGSIEGNSKTTND
jgi:integrase